MADNEYFFLKNVRCSFPHLFKKPIINGKEGKCGSTFLLDPKDADHKAQIKNISNFMNKVKANSTLKDVRIPPDKKCLRKGEDTSRTEYDGYWIVSSNSKGKPIVMAANGKTQITSEEECPIYAGCRVTAKLRIWAQDNKWGKRINADLVAIQFFADDEPLDGSHVPVEEAMEGFEGVGGGDDDFDLDDEHFDDALANDEIDSEEFDF